MARRVSSPTFIGRNAELERLTAALGAAATDGRPAAFLVAGEAGVGKTRLMSELAGRARTAGFRVLTGGCIELAEGGLPFAPIVEALRPLGSELSPDALAALAGPGRAELARLLPELGELATRADHDATGAAQGRLFELLLLFLRRLAAERAVLLVLEDLHWADRSTLDILGFLVRNLRDAPLVLVATYRSDELHRRHPLLPVLAELTRTGRIGRFELARFGPDELAAQLAGITGAPAERELVERIYARSGGNPFYTEELLAAGAFGERLPPTLREVLLVRVAALSDPTQELLRIASVAGGPVTGALLAAVTATHEADLLPALREAVAHGILVVDPAGTAFAFRHALTGEAVADELLPGERTTLHTAYALELSRDPGWTDDPARAAAVTAHWTAAHDLPRAFEASVVAGLAAERTYAYPEAQAQYERALELWTKVPEAATLSSLDRVDFWNMLRPRLRPLGSRRGRSPTLSSRLPRSTRPPSRPGLGCCTSASVGHTGSRTTALAPSPPTMRQSASSRRRPRQRPAPAFSAGSGAVCRTATPNRRPCHCSTRRSRWRGSWALPRSRPMPSARGRP